MQGDIDGVLISQEQIAKRVAELAGMIMVDHTPARVTGAVQLTLVPVMTGAMIFCADLMRQIPIARPSDSHTHSKAVPRFSG